MKKALIFCLSGVVMAGLAVAQDGATGSQRLISSQTASPAQPQASPQTPTSQSSAPGEASTAHNTVMARIAPGSVIPVELAKTVDAKKAKTGDEVVAKVTQDLKNNNGEIIIAKDTKVMGHVTEAQARSKGQKESELAIAFDKAISKSGPEIQMPMSIQAIIGQQSNQSNAGSEPGPPSAVGGGPSAGGRTGGGTNQAPQSGEMPSESQTGTNARPPITGQTKGVIGIPNLTLNETVANASQGSLMTSEKNNVKLEGGTMMLLRVNP